MKIYLAGSIPKGKQEEENFFDWRENYKEVLEKTLKAELITPLADIDEADFLLVVGNDSKNIRNSDLVIVNAQEKLGAGTSMEMVIAKYFKKPVVAILPKNSYHRRPNLTFQNKYFVSDWIHPFIHTFSDFIIEKISDIQNIKDQIFKTTAKDISIVDQAIAHLDSNKAHNKKGHI